MSKELSLARHFHSSLFTHNEDTLLTPDPVEFLETFVFDPETGKLLKLEPEQRDVVWTLSERVIDASGDWRYKYSEWVYSAPKKSGKTTVAAGLTLWQAWQVAVGQCYVIGNDQKQADSRLFRVIKYAVEHHPLLRRMGRVVKFNIFLENETYIEALPVDPTGEAGMNPTCLTWTEVWGAKGQKAELMWSEAALSPTRKGKSFKLLESYAGHEGESTILERVYQNVVQDENLVDPVREIYVNKKTSSIAYWCTRRYLPWQNDEFSQQYYANEVATKTPEEYKRLHENQWGSVLHQFVPVEWWDACENEEELITEGKLCVIALDAGVSGDCFAVTLVGKEQGEKEGLEIIVEYETKIYTPPKNGTIDFEEVETYVKLLCEQYIVTCITYDPYQLHDMSQRLKRQGVTWLKSFDQNMNRLKADKAFYDRLRDRRFRHTGNPEVKRHLQNAARKNVDENKLRIVKKKETEPIDAVVALSMACEVAAWLNL